MLKIFSDSDKRLKQLNKPYNWSQSNIRLPLLSLSEGKKLAIFQETLTRDTFEKIMKTYFWKFLQLLKEFWRGWIPKEYIDEIVLVGASTRIPKVRQLIKKYFNGKAPNVSLTRTCSSVGVLPFRQELLVVCGHSKYRQLKLQTMFAKSMLSISQPSLWNKNLPYFPVYKSTF